MIQIIGWLGCAMLAVKLLEMFANPALRDESGNPKGSVIIAIVLGWASVFGFAYWLGVQGEAFPSLDTAATESSAFEPLTQEQIECIERNSGNSEAMLACAP